MEEEEADSLFEGMILFTPSQVAAAADATATTDSGPLPASTTATPPPPPVFPPPDASSSEPLDENLFSDLTVVTSSQAPLPVEEEQREEVAVTEGLSDPIAGIPAAASTEEEAARSETTIRKDAPAVSRQMSRRKRRPGLRIGYGRHSSDSDAPAVEDLDCPASASPPLQEESAGPHRPAADSSHPQGAPDPSSAVANEAPVESSTHAGSSADRDDALQTVCTGDAAAVAAAPVSGGNDRSTGESEETSPSAEVRFEQIRSRISEKLKHARDLAASVSAKRKDCTRRRREASESLKVESAKHRELEKQLEEACEAEDFETAERLSECLGAAETQKQALLSALRETEAESDVIDSDMHQVLEQQLATEEECVSLLQLFASEAANDADIVSKKAVEVSSKKLDEWLSSTEALEVKKMELDVESYLINETRSVLNDSIEHSVEVHQRERDLFCNKKELLMDELLKLLSLVEEKEKEIAETDSNIQAIEKRISDVLSGFQTSRSIIEENYDRLQSGILQMESEDVSLLNRKIEIDDYLSHENDRSMKLMELASISADEAKDYQEIFELRRSLLSSIMKSKMDKSRFMKSEEKLSAEVQMLRQKASSERASVQDLSSSKSNLQQECASIKQRLLFIEKRVPELETEKKVAATARNFKEAARISGEAKTLSIEKEDLLSNLEGAMSELRKLDEKIKESIEGLQNTEELISSKEKEVAVARSHRLHLVSRSTLAERFAALELGDLEEADLLLAEAEAAESDAKRLQQDFGFEGMETLSEYFFSLELVSNYGKKQLAELAASTDVSAV